MKFCGLQSFDVECRQRHVFLTISPFFSTLRFQYSDPAFNFHEIQDRHFQPDLSIGSSTSSSGAALVEGV